MNVERVAYGATKDLSQSLHKSGEETPRHQLRTELICRTLYRTVCGAEATSECELTSHPNLEAGATKKFPGSWNNQRSLQGERARSNLMSQCQSAATVTLPTNLDLTVHLRYAPLS